MNLSEKVTRQNKIKDFMEGTLFEEAAEAVVRDLTEQLLSTDFQEKREREDIYLMIKAFTELKQKLTTWVDDGIFAQAELDHLEQVEKDERDQD